MGCDIHLVLERRHGAKWVAVDTFTSFHRQYAAEGARMDGYSMPIARARNYERFAALASVRGSGATPLGLPPDASETTLALSERDGIDGHSHSWIPLRDAARVWTETEHGKLSDFAKKYPESHYFNVDCSEGSRDDVKNYRVVFWFDN